MDRPTVAPHKEGEELSTKVLLDTDIGTDVDDAVCLAYLLNHPDCDLLGITTVTGEAEKRAQLASVLCTRAGREVPIYPGADNPLIVPQKQPVAQQAEALPRWEHTRQFPRGEAVEFMRRTIRKHPGEITLLTIAPLTNIGLLFTVDPEIPSLLKQLVMMCGRFTDNIPGYGPIEWNAAGDPHATTIVYRSRVKIHRSVGLDVTSRVTMEKDEFRRSFHSDLFRPVLDFAEIWFRDWPGVTFHDPLAAATIFKPELCTYRRGTVSIETSPDDHLGMTRWKADAAGHHDVASDVDRSGFFAHYRSIVR